MFKMSTPLQRLRQFSAIRLLKFSPKRPESRGTAETSSQRNYNALIHPDRKSLLILETGALSTQRINWCIKQGISGLWSWIVGWKTTQIQDSVIEHRFHNISWFYWSGVTLSFSILLNVNHWTRCVDLDNCRGRDTISLSWAHLNLHSEGNAVMYF